MFKTTLTASIFVLFTFIFVLLPKTVEAKRPLSIVGDPNFSTSSLSPEMKVWYDRLWNTINGTSLPDPENAMDDTYAIGRVYGPYSMALLNAFRITGDLKLLDELDRLLEKSKQYVVDTNGDGYKWWKFLQDPNSIYYNKEYRLIDDYLTAGTIAEVAYALKQNAQFKSTYGTHADYWASFLKKNYEEYYVKKGGGTFPEKTLTHAYTGQTMYHYFMYRITGNTTYLNTAKSRTALVGKMMIPYTTANGQAYVWDHRMTALGEDPYQCQPTWYATLTMGYFQQFALDGFDRYAGVSYMKHFTDTSRDLVFKYGVAKTEGDICDDAKISGVSPSGYDDFAADKSVHYLGSYVTSAYWGDSTGKIKQMANAFYSEYYKAPQSFNLHSGMMMIIAGQEGYPMATGTTVPTSTTSPTQVPTATATPRPSATPTGSTPAPTTGATVSGDTITFNPIADTYADSSSATSNYGTNQVLTIEGSPERIGFMQFDLAPLAGKTINSAKLKLRVYTSSSSESLSTHSVKAISPTTFSENSLTFNSRPGVTSTVLGTFVPSTLGGWTEVNITNFVKSNAGKTSAFAITQTTGDTARFFSRESTSKPELIVTTASVATPVPTTAPTTIPTINPTVSPITDNLLKNPSFETDPYVNYFTHTQGGGSFVHSAGNRTGDHSVKIVSTQTTNNLHRWLTNTGTLSVQPGETYEARVWIKTFSTTGKAYLALTYWAADALQSISGSVSSSSVTGTNDWKEVVVRGTVPANAYNIRFEMRLEGAGTVYFDDAYLKRVGTSTVTPAPTQTPLTSVNLLKNPGYESDPYLNYQTSGNGSLTHASDQYYKGSRSVKISSNLTSTSEMSRWYYKNNTLPVTPGKTYEAAVWIKAEKVTGSGTLKLYFFDSNNQLLGGGGSIPVNGTSNWQEIKVAQTAPNNSSYARIELRLNGAGTVWFDVASLIEK